MRNEMMNMLWTYRGDKHQTKLVEQHGVEYIQFPGFCHKGMIHGISTRQGGVSQGVCATMNLSFSRGDDQERVLENHRRFAKAVGYDYTRLVCSDQVHSTNIYQVTREDCGKGVIKDSDLLEIDGLITDEINIPLMTFYADCVPLLFYDPVARVIGNAHSGWRGTVAGMGKVMVETMVKQYGCDRKNICCAIGPSICQDCYEVSQDVVDEFVKQFGAKETEEFVRDKGQGKFQLDLWKANEKILLGAGILAQHIKVTNVCTCCNPEKLFSHRFSMGKRGNLGAVIMMTEVDEDGNK